MSKGDEDPFCGEDKLGDERQPQLIEAARKKWCDARQDVLTLMVYLLCCYCMRVVIAMRLRERGLDEGLLLGAAQLHLIRAMDAEEGGKPFCCCETDFDIWRKCWGFIHNCTRSAKRDLERKMRGEQQLVGEADIPSRETSSIENAGLAESVKLCIQQLTPKQRQVVPVFMETMTQADLARELGISEAAVHKRCVGAKQRLRELLGKKEEPSEH